MSTWKFQINDPSLPAWLCVGAYLISGGLAFRTARFSPTKGNRFWRGIWLSCWLLAINKQLDIHSLVLMAFQTIASGGKLGLTLFEIVVLGVFSCIGVCATALVLRNLKNGTANIWTAAGCLFVIGVFFIVRNTIPVMSAFLGWHLITEEQTLLHIHLSEVLELFSAGVIAIAASRESARIAGESVWNKSVDRVGS